jgi:hypothetical protein
MNLIGIESQILLTSQAVTRHLLQETSQLYWYGCMVIARG